MRLLPEKENYFEKLKNLTKKINEETKELKPKCTIDVDLDDSREETSQCLQFVFTVKTVTKQPRVYSIGMYLLQNKQGVETIIVNGRTGKLLFENCTINSPEIAIHYLNDILLNEVKWVANLEGKLYDKKKTNNKRKYQKRPVNNSKGNSSDRGNAENRERKPNSSVYEHKDGRPNDKRNNNSNTRRNNDWDNSYRKDKSIQKNTSNHNKSHNNNQRSNHKKYGDQGTGKRKTGSFKGSTGEGRITYQPFSNIGNAYPVVKTTKNPYND